jgi:hypothetical protein
LVGSRERPHLPVLDGDPNGGWWQSIQYRPNILKNVTIKSLALSSPKVSVSTSLVNEGPLKLMKAT